MRCLIRIAFMCFWLLLGFSAAVAQTTHVDSLEHLFSATDDYDEQIRLLGELSDYYSYRDSAKAMGYALRLKNLAENRNDRRGLGIAHYRIGAVYFELNEVDSAIKEYERAVSLLEKDTTFLGQQILARSWYNQGAQYQRKGDDWKFLDFILNHSTPIYERIGDSLGMGRNFHNIGIIFENIKEYDRSAYYQRKAIEVLKSYPEVAELADAYSKLAEMTIYADDADTTQRDVIRNALAEADTLLLRFPDTYSRVLYFNSLGLYEELFEGRLDKALEHYLHGHLLAYESGMHKLGANLLNRAYYIYDKQGNHRLALQTTDRLLSEYGSYLTPRDRLVQLRNTINSKEKLGDIQEAYHLQKHYVVLNDSIQAAEAVLKIRDLEQKYDASEKEAQIARLNQQMNAQELQAQRNRLLVILMGVTILLIVGISLASYNISRKKQLIASQKAKLLKQNMEKMRQEQQIGVFSAMLEGQEQERKRLAIDLHDGLGGTLSSIKMKLSKVVQANGHKTDHQELPVILKQLDGSVDDLRRIARNLMPETLLKYGLAVALRDFCKGLEQEGTTVSFQSYGLQNNMPKSIQIMIYRIVQELITNAVKHANANCILAQCLQNGNELSITVEDDGVGFDGEGNGPLPGMGLVNVRTRVAYMGAKMDIHSEKGVGTTVNIELTYADE